MGDSSLLSTRLNAISSPYKTWLPALIERIDELSAVSDENALQHVKELLKKERSKYQEYQLKSQFPDGKETDEQFKARMIMKRSSGPMIRVLERAIQHVKDCETTTPDADVATVIQQVRNILEEES